MRISRESVPRARFLERRASRGEQRDLTVCRVLPNKVKVASNRFSVVQTSRCLLGTRCRKLYDLGRSINARSLAHFCSQKRRFSPWLAHKKLAQIRSDGITIPRAHKFLSGLLRELDIEDVRVGDRDFSRCGALSPELLIAILLFMAGDGNRRGYRHLLNTFWDQATDFEIDLPSTKPVTAASFCTAREKVAPEFLRSLVHAVWQKMLDDFPDASSFRGRQVYAVDGCKINVKRSPELDREFGRPSGAYVPQVLMSALVNVCSRTPVDVAVRGHASCERSILLEEHLQFLSPGDILVLDRGYPSYEMIRALLDARVDFLVRTPVSSTFPAIAEFLATEANDAVVYLDLPGKASCQAQRVKLRAIRTQGPDGPAVFLTSLARGEWSWSTLTQLYKLRWESEELYKTLKSDYLDPRQFHSHKAQGVRQEICATMLFLGISRYLMAAAAEVHDSPLHEISQKGAVLCFGQHLVRLFRADSDSAAHVVQLLLHRIARSRDKRRPHRSAPRVSNKPRSKWTPTGRRGR